MKKYLLLIVVIISTLSLCGCEDLKDPEGTKFTTTKVVGISKEEAENILIRKYGAGGDDGMVYKYHYIARVKDKDGKYYYAFRQTSTIELATNVMQTIFISLDGNTTITNPSPYIYKEDEVVDFNQTEEVN